jgi:hypothetical protein
MLFIFTEIKVLKSVNKLYFGPKWEKVGEKLFKMYVSQNLGNGMAVKISKIKGRTYHFPNLEPLKRLKNRYETFLGRRK